MISPFLSNCHCFLFSGGKTQQERPSRCYPPPQSWLSLPLESLTNQFVFIINCQVDSILFTGTTQTRQEPMATIDSSSCPGPARLEPNSISMPVTMTQLLCSHLEGPGTLLLGSRTLLVPLKGLTRAITEVPIASPLLLKHFVS